MSDLEKDWTIMVYMAGDNNLSENMAYSLADLSRGFGIPDDEAKDKINLCAFFDGSSLTAPTKYIDFSAREDDGLKFVEQEADRKKPFEYDLPRDENTATATSIINFVRWCIEKQGRRAKNYALIFSGHSFGFHGTSFLRDENSGGFMTLFMFRWALEQINARYLQKKISILGFDSCVMSMLEVAYELKNTSLTMVASEGSLPNSGWGYAPLLQKFIARYDPKPPDEKSDVNFIETPKYVREAATSFVDAFIDHHNELLIGGRSVDIAAWDLELIDDVVKSVNEFGGLLNSHLDLTERIAQKKLTDDDIRRFHELKKIILQSQYDSQSYMRNQCIDLVDFCQRFILECEFVLGGQDREVFEKLQDAAGDVIDKVQECIMLSGFSGDEYQFSNGMSIYFPWSLLTFTLTNYRYRHLYINRGERGDSRRETPDGPGSNWYYFLQNYLSRVTFRLARNGKPTQLPDNASDGSVWSKDNPRWNKDNPRWNKDNPRFNKDNPRLNRDNPRLNRGEIGEYLFYFERFKNVQMAWDINGFTKDKKKDDKSKGEGA